MLLPFLFQGTLMAQNEGNIPTKYRDWYFAINDNLDSFRLVTKKFEDGTQKGGYMKVYYEKDSIVLFHAEYEVASGKTSDDYYFKDGKLFFVYSIITPSMGPMYDPTMPGLSPEENRYYFSEGKMTIWLDTRRARVDSTTEEYTIRADEVLYELSRLKSLLVGE